MRSPTAACHECAWTCDALGAEPEELAEAAGALEDHLASAHDLSYPRAQEIARQWARRVLFAEPDSSPSAR